MKRRDFMRASLIGCSAAASPLITPVTFASAPWDNRLVVIILRGGMDGLDVVQPYGDPDLAKARPSLSAGPDGGATDLDGFYALHPALAPLAPLWKQGELSFAHAASTPYRNKRSHFDGQDVLEAGAFSGTGTMPRDGWLNRLLQVSPGVEAETAYAVGTSRMYLTEGPARTSSWTPRSKLDMSEQARRLLELVYHDDDLFRAASETALDIVGSLEASAEADAEAREEMMATMSEMGGVGGNARLAQVAEFAAQRLRGDTRIAAFSLGGWDTHSRQRQGIGRALGALAQSILVLKAGLGPVWGKTTVVAMTEFGRTVRENGSAGTDHGTGGAMLFAGGTLRRSQVVADWPGLAEADLFDRRDLMPTADVRHFAGWVMRDTFGTDRTTLEDVIFPGLDLGPNPGLMA